MSLAELLVTLFVALIVFGPQKLPEVASRLGRVFFKLNRLKQQFSTAWQKQLDQEQLRENTRKAEKADLFYQKQSTADE